MEFEKYNSVISGETFTAILIKDAELGLTNLSDLKTVIDGEMNSGNIRIIIDLQHVAVINSSGLGVLIGALARLKAKSGAMKIINANDKLMNIFRITKLDHVFELI